MRRTAATRSQADATSGAARARLQWVTAFAGAGPTFAGEMTMAWTLLPEGSGTRVMVEARGVPPGVSAEDHAEGLVSTLRGLARAALRR